MSNANRPRLRLVAKEKSTGIYTELGVAWPARNGDREIPGTFNLRLGGRDAEVTITVKPKGGKPFTVTGLDHFVSVYDNGTGEKEDF